MSPVQSPGPATLGVPDSPIAVEVIYAEPERAVGKTYRLTGPAKVEDVLRLAAADPYFAEVDLTRAAVGIFGRPAPAGQYLLDGDRVEIYRPLAADPKQARRERARQARKQR